MDKNTLNKLLEEGKLTETLMKDESFKKEARKILKEENLDITDWDITHILKIIEKVLSGEIKLESDENLNNVTGGLGDTGKTIVRNTIKGALACSGFVFKIPISGLELGDYINDRKLAAAAYTAQGAAQGYAGYKFGEWICKKLGLEE